MGESFSAELRAEADGIWEKIFGNPFLRQLQDGTLPPEKFRYYLAQDYLYLEGFARAVALALAKAPDPQELERLARRVPTPVERPLHQKLMALVDMSLDDVERMGHSPTNLAYINHMVSTAALGGLGQTAAALLPCPWSYYEIGSLLGPVEHQVYSQWAATYKEGLLEESTQAWRGFLDREAAQSGPREREAMRRAFLTSSRYEFMFWQMAYNQEAWPV